ncbi:sigma-54 interaction domain-containing protein [Bacillus badius]|uniref:Sigma-54 dependent transcriptional regulator n=1 Tax=Bacillus badius TaxID=1455 RepID=A0ABR5AZ05_BACBA|nr:sigma 54-interacting transcriptional regulator [Bacillus badius]KIL75049.1 sigma-54 dependent transcriptional regulator [Bacillus badius]KIL79969.1 sigma-54 dependent transcriptional regulator [Bacillus badius]MED4714966.1 sigma 54-interacting transcriptional regulator [Bacillus badius]
MKELIIISLGVNTLESMTEQIKRYVGDEVAIRGYSIEKGVEEDFKDKIVLLTGAPILQHVAAQVQGAKKIIVARRALSYRHIEKLFMLKEKTNVLLVNDTKESCYEAIEQLKGHGFHSLAFFPYYPGISSYSSCAIAVTPGESRFVPPEVSEVIDIGNRQVDITTITEIMSELNILKKAGMLASSEFVSEIIELTKYLSIINRKLDDSNLLLTMIFDKFPKALLFCDEKGQVTYSNEKMKWIFEGNAFLDVHVTDLFGAEFDIRTAQYYEEELFQLRNNTYILSVDKVENEKEVICYLIELENYDNFKYVDQVISSKINSGKFIARYQFAHIHSRNERMNRMIQLAKRMAKRQGSILIQGESGTGKELLAQAIHNESPRSNQPFVPVNCAALSPSVLESELFGYEEGAFTGAKKGGKRGLFESANHGTLFLDEIGETPLDVQAKLLRVIEEGEVRRVGSNHQVPVDVRIISATNQNLADKVADGSFRKDLYYRLNVLPLDTVPLRERKEDIMPLVHHYLNVFTQNNVYHVNEYLDKEAADFLSLHPWPGNVRELVNIVEYMVNIKLPKQRMGLNDLPAYFIAEWKSEEPQTELKQIKPFLSAEEQVLLIIYQKYGIGRRRIVQELENRGLSIGEGKVKLILEALRKKGWIEVNKGVRGCTVSQRGEKQARKIAESATVAEEAD